ncbi:MAG: hypothetical protein ACK5ME_00275 [Parahaliea sp.]
MFTLFALLTDTSSLVTNDSLIRDLKKDLPGVEEYGISKKELVFPKVTVVLLQKAGWRVRFQIRKGENMTLSLPELQRILGTKTQLPTDLLSYNTEITIGFGDDPEKKYTNDIIFIGEFVRENYPGVVIFDQYNEDVW